MLHKMSKTAEDDAPEHTLRHFPCVCGPMVFSSCDPQTGGLSNPKHTHTSVQPLQHHLTLLPRLPGHRSICSLAQLPRFQKSHGQILLKFQLLVPSLALSTFLYRYIYIRPFSCALFLFLLCDVRSNWGLFVNPPGCV